MAAEENAKFHVEIKKYKMVSCFLQPLICRDTRTKHKMYCFKFNTLLILPLHTTTESGSHELVPPGRKKKHTNHHEWKLECTDTIFQIRRET